MLMKNKRKSQHGFNAIKTNIGCESGMMDPNLQSASKIKSVFTISQQGRLQKFTQIFG
jgi:hypothetical protein